VLDYRYLASKWDLNSHHALQAGLVWVCDALDRSDLAGSVPCRQLWQVGRSVKRQRDAGIESSLLQVEQLTAGRSVRWQCDAGIESSLLQVEQQQLVRQSVESSLNQCRIIAY